MSSPNYRLRSAVLILGAGVLYALVARFALNASPFSGDEYSYLMQAEGFARGELKGKAPAYADWVAVDHVVIDDFVRSKYPPGTAALLALGVKAGVPWLVTPLEAVLVLLFAWATAALLLDERRAFLTVAFLAASPLFAYDAASFFSHTASLLWLSIATLCVALWSKGKRPGYLVAFGLCVGCMFLTRPLDAAIMGLSLVALGSIPALVVAGASALPFVAASLRYNQLQFGSPFVNGYQAYGPAFAKLYGATGTGSSLNPMHLVSPPQIWNHLTVFETLVAQWTVPGAALLACLGWVALRKPSPGDRKAEPLLRFFGALILLSFGALLFTLADPDDGPRPRYLSPLLLPLAFLAAAGWDTAAEFVRSHLGKRLSRVVAAAVWLAPLFLLAAYLERRVPESVVRSGLAQEVARQGLTSGVVVVRAEWPARYARNGMFFDHPPIFLSVPPRVSVDEVANRFPGQAVYEATEPHGDNPWKHPWTVTRVK